MFGLFTRDPTKKLQRQYETLLTDAMAAQRKGDIKRYSMLTEEAEAIRVKIEQIQGTK
ncbi:DUF6435 family protein [Simiduia agarivorans]|uniref:Lacal_2735 family protein n=1 Tax=Simiduia agarivorans (strain DSM 21679 / JCM 13881 / BCRC 17597 / SA1) TaxID=1117647 RepID=K4KH78_SIMAS|nr:DUF6435 family protein [Simiduia agarivorans]AFU98361.1 hypothetical protein M5M_05800 [Simiduia agarivorans SA1 = DSM 21679]